MKKNDGFGFLIVLVLGIALIAAMYIFPEALQMNPYSMHKKIKALESRVYELETTRNK